MKNLKNIIILSLILLITIPLAGCSKPKTSTEIPNKKLFDQLDLSDIDKLMVVAHPDDETIWGGAHLLKKHYLVVCLTNGYNKRRVKEYNKVIKMSGNKGLILKYPDKVNGKRSNWEDCKDKVENDLRYLLKLKNFKTVITHNPTGEYGHIHHQFTNQIVTKVMKNKLDDLVYFGVYYKKSNLPNNLKAISQTELTEKNKLIKVYKSQKKVMEHLGHMFPYENWIKYKNWR